MNIVEEAAKEGLSEIQINAIMGSLMGDGSLRPSGKTTAAIRWNHGACQHDYVIAKYQLLSEFATQPPFQIPNPGYGDTWSVLTLKSCTAFHYLRTLLQNPETGKKTITKEFLEQITHPIALAWWFLDDGSRSAGQNNGRISTNGFSKEENELLSNWLLDEWQIVSTVMPVKQTNGNQAWNLALPTEGYTTMMLLIEDYVPQCMKYKTEIMFRICETCGKPFIVNKNNDCCSKECQTIMRKAHKHNYWEAHKEESMARNKAWAEAHRDRVNELNRERYARLTQEQKEELNAYMRAWRRQNHEHWCQVRQAWRASRKDDPVYREKRRQECMRYWQNLKNDPVRHEKRLERQRARRQREDVKAHDRVYLRNYRMEKRAQDPEKLQEYLDRQARMQSLKTMSAEERHEDTNKRAMDRYYARRAQETPEETEARKEKQRERERKRKAERDANPELRAQFLEAEKRRRAARKARKLQKQQNGLEMEIAPN